MLIKNPDKWAEENNSWGICNVTNNDRGIMLDIVEFKTKVLYFDTRPVSVRFSLEYENNGNITKLELGTEVNPNGDKLNGYVFSINQADATALPDWIDKRELICDMDTLIEEAREGEKRIKEVVFAPINEYD